MIQIVRICSLKGFIQIPVNRWRQVCYKQITQPICLQTQRGPKQLLYFIKMHMLTNLPHKQQSNRYGYRGFSLVGHIGGTERNNATETNRTRKFC